MSTFAVEDGYRYVCPDGCSALNKMSSTPDGPWNVGASIAILEWGESSTLKNLAPINRPGGVRSSRNRPRDYRSKGKICADHNAMRVE
jgi:hypothetical protein